jgi:uncharacterized protein
MTLRYQSSLLSLLFICSVPLFALSEESKQPFTSQEVEQLLHAAKEGDIDSENALAILYSNGKAEPYLHRDSNMAMTWWTRAAKRGQQEAALHLGMANFFPIDHAPNYQAGIDWLKQSAQLGNAHAQYLFGNICFKGLHTPKDVIAAIKLWTESSAQGYSKAQRSLGELYLAGDGVKQDNLLGIELLRKAAYSDAIAQFDLGLMYWNGDRVSVDKTLAIELWQKAANNGNGKAQVRLADAYAQGTVVPTDKKKALFWYDVAISSSGVSSSDARHVLDARRAIKETMSPNEIAAAKQAADERIANYLRDHMVTETNWVDIVN